MKPRTRSIRPEVASGLCGDDNDLWWGGQRLLKELAPAAGAEANACFI